MAYTTIDDPSAYFYTELFTGNGSTQSITNNANAGDFKPDWLWIKSRGTTHGHAVFDSSRGGNARLAAEGTQEERTNEGNVTFQTDGFNVTSSHPTTNNNSTYMVSWQWKANGGTTSTDTNGAVDSTVQANTTAGFSIVTWTSAGSTNVGHGLGVAPNLIIMKARNATENWLVGSDEIDWAKRIKLNSTDGSANSSAFGQAPTSSIFYCSPASSSYNYVAYCFSEVQGYSKFGSYKGNGNADGPFIYTGFKPAWVMWKRTDASGNSWGLVDHRRNKNDTSDVGNVIDVYLAPDLDNDDSGNGDAVMDFLSNGFKIRRTGNFINVDGSTYVYMAFAENPFVSSKGVPTTAR